MTVPGFTSAILLLTELAPHMIEEAETGILIVNMTGQICYANKGAEDLIGLPRDLFLGEQVERFVPPDLRDQHVSLRESYITGTGGPRVRWMGSASEVSLHGARGERIPVRIGLMRLMTLSSRYVAVYIYPRQNDPQEPGP